MVDGCHLDLNDVTEDTPERILSILRYTENNYTSRIGFWRAFAETSVGDGVFFIVWEVFSAWNQANFLLFDLFAPRVCDCVSSL